MKVSLKFFAALTLVALVGSAAHAQAFPSKPIRFVVAFAPGGGTDVIARILGKRLSEALGQPVVIENRGGAGGSIATRAVALAKADGYTILVHSNAVLLTPALSKSAGYDPLRDLAPIINAGSTPTVLVAHPSFQSANLKELIALSKTKPIFYSSAGVGTIPFLFVENINKNEGSKFTHVPFPGAAPALNAVAAGHVQFAALAGETSSLKEFIQAGKLRPIVVTSKKRWSARPEIPTIAEAGFPDYLTSSWIGFFAPSGTPKEITAQLNKELGKILADPAVNAQTGREWEPNATDDFAAALKSEYEGWQKIVGTLNMKTE